MTTHPAPPITDAPKPVASVRHPVVRGIADPAALGLGDFGIGMEGRAGGEGKGTFLILCAVFTAFLVVPCTRISVLLTVLFSAAAITSVLVAVGAYASSESVAHAAGYTGFAVGILGLCGCFASLANATWHRTVIALGSRE